jgi:hypothetical protein
MTSNPSVIVPLILVPTWMLCLACIVNRVRMETVGYNRDMVF